MEVPRTKPRAPTRTHIFTQWPFMPTLLPGATTNWSYATLTSTTKNPRKPTKGYFFPLKKLVE